MGRRLASFVLAVEREALVLAREAPSGSKFDMLREIVAVVF